MKAIKIILFTAALSLGALSAHGQDGLLMSTSRFTTLDILEYSRIDHSFTTARVASMGGAFTALGGDLGAVGINPAGLGMYNEWAVGFSPSISVASLNGDRRMHRNDRSRFTLNNFGFVIPSATSNYTWTFSYNKVSDFNYRGSTTMPASASSILDVHTLQLSGLSGHLNNQGWNGIPEDWIRGDNKPWYNLDIDPEEWGAVLGYRNYAIDPLAGGENLYTLGTLAPGAMSTPSIEYDSRGSIGEYSYSGAWNILDVVYFGYGLSMQSISRDVAVRYTETYSDNAPTDSSLRLSDMNYDQFSSTSGFGLNFKMGLIVVPTPALMLGMAYHSPMYMSLTRRYSASMETAFLNSLDGYYDATGTAESDFEVATPSRLLFGAAFVLGNWGALSTDYEIAWYNKINATDYDGNDISSIIEKDYRPTSNFRVGLEVMPTYNIALHAGFAYYASPLRKASDATGNILDNPTWNGVVTTSTHNISAGVGFALGGGATLDLAYIYSINKFAPYSLYHYSGEIRPGSTDTMTYSGGNITGSRLGRNIFTMSLSFVL